MKSNLRDLLIKEILHRFNENTPRIEKCLDEVSEEQVWARPNSASNSIANLIIHLCGNITQYVISGLGGFPDTRNRDAEFEILSGNNKAQLLERLHQTVRKASEIIAGLSEEELMKSRTVQGFNVSGVDIIVHVTEHYSYHTGQIAFWTKLILNKDLGFYAGVDLNAKNDD